jgi:threonine dehydratase
VRLPVTLEDVQAAAPRIAPHVRRTPTIEWTCRGSSGGERRDGLLGRAQVVLKLEQLQVGGSFKARGAVNRIAVAAPAEAARGLVTASGGNHGIGVAWAAARFGVPATVFLPAGAPASTEARLRQMGALVERAGVVWDDAWRAAEERAARDGALLVHPFEDPRVIAGQGTVALELLADAPELDALVVAVGGGGLIGGVGVVAKALRPSLRLVGVEPKGAASMRAALAAGRVVPLDEVRTIAGTLAPRAIGPTTLALAQALVDEVVTVSDEQMRAAMRLAWDELRLLVEPAGAAALAALVGGRAGLDGARRIGVLICGANLDVEAVLGG